MKTTLYFLFLITVLSCSKDNATNNTSLLIGTWDGVLDEQGNGPDEDPVIFLENGRTEWVYKAQGNDGEDISELSDWDLDGDKLILTYSDPDPGDDGVIEITLLQLTETNLRWRYEADPGLFITSEYTKR